MTLLEVTSTEKTKSKSRNKNAKEHKANTNNMYSCILPTHLCLFLVLLLHACSPSPCECIFSSRLFARSL